MPRSSFHPIPALLSVLSALWVLGCGASEPAVVTVEATPTPSQGVHLVQHELDPVQPAVQWTSTTIERAPLSLTAGDGSGLRLQSITGTVVIEDPLAFTELRLAFHNPERRRREGRFEVDLPPDAALSRLAMKIGGTWMEGEVVERAKAQRTFEQFIHRRPQVDPALLEKAAANRVSARVFPIEPLADKEIIVSYSQPLLGGNGRYRLPLAGLPQLDALDLKVIVKTTDPSASDRFPTASQRVIEISERNVSGREDLEIALDGADEAAGVRTDELVALRIRPPALPQTEPVDALTVLFDTSASAAGAFEHEVDRLEAFLGALGEATVRVVAFDQTREQVFEGPGREAAGESLAALRERRAFGASDLYAALADPIVSGGPGTRLLLWSDGVATMGAQGSAALSEIAAELPFARIDAYAPTTVSDRSVLAAVASASEDSGFVLGPRLDGEVLARRLTDVGFDDVAVEVAGAEWSFPRSLRGVAPDEDLVVYAGFRQGVPERAEVRFSDPRMGRHEIATLVGAAPLVERAVATARVAELSRQLEKTTDIDEAQSLRSRLVKLATGHRILTEHTALLVLENESEYRRYGIARHALADILTVGVGGVELLRRGGGPTGTHLPPVSAAVADARLQARRDGISAPARDGGILGQLSADSGHFLSSPYGAAFAIGNDDEDVWGGLTGTEVGEAFGVGGLGLSGTGRGGGGVGEGTIGLGNVGLIGRGGGGGVGTGYGSGSGRGFGGRGKRVPRVRMASPTVRGALDREIVRRIVRSHINEIRFCYNRALALDPAAAGQVAVKFVIGPTGRVATAVTQHSTLGDAPAERCMAKAVQRWRFPKPSGGGNVTVSYPFHLRADGSSWSAAPRMARARRSRPVRRRRGDPSDGPQWVGSAQSGRFAGLQALIAAGDSAQARSEAWSWASTEHDNALAIVALGEILEIDKRPELAARVYGSLIDLYPHRADMRRAAGARLEAVGARYRAMAIDTYRKAVAQRPDQINGHRLLAWALTKDGNYEQAFTVLSEAIGTRTPPGRFNGARSLLRADRELVAAAWLSETDEADPEVSTRIRAAGVRPATTVSLRLVADWETDATDVDLLVDPIGPGDGRRHADVRDGFGPEAWISTRGKRPTAVSARVRYFDRGAMGYAMGTVSAVSHDGQGNLSFTDRPFVIMEARGSVELGRFRV